MPLQPLTGSTVGTLQIEPLLLKKGTTKLALYGLGNVRDERLARAFNTPEGIKWCASLCTCLPTCICVVAGITLCVLQCMGMLLLHAHELYTCWASTLKHKLKQHALS